MKYLALIPLLCVGAAVFCVTAFRADADSDAADVTPYNSATVVTEEVAAERAFREDHRAFYTAPPVIPHDLFPVSAGDCLTCHRQERTYFGKVSTKTPHPHLSNCTQCHLASNPAFTKVEATPVETTWKGLETPTDGTRAHVVAPPTMPHRKLLREDCQSCHSNRSPFESLRGPHPERTNCVQCHVPVSESEFTIEHDRTLPTK